MLLFLCSRPQEIMASRMFCIFRPEAVNIYSTISLFVFLEIIPLASRSFNSFDSIRGLMPGMLFSISV